MTPAPPQPVSVRISGFTLIELIVSMVIITAVLLASQSAMLVAARALPSQSSHFERINQTADVLDLLAADLRYAIAIEKRTSTEVVLQTPDRNGDKAAERIAYTWSGKAGDSLYRRYNNETPQAIADNVQEFNLTFDTLGIPLPQTFTESNEVLLGSNNSLINLGSYRVQSSNWIGQYIRPSLPAEASSWSVTRALVRAKSRGATGGETKVQIRPGTSAFPGSQVLDQATMFESSLSSLLFQWQEFQFSNAQNILPSDGVCLVLQWAKDADACEIEYQLVGSSSPAGNMLVTANAGSTWAPQVTQHLMYYLYGKIKTPDPIQYRYLLNSVQCSLRLGSSDVTRLTTTVRTLNQPEVNGL